MDLEARSLPPNVKAVLLAKLREYKSDLNNLKNEVKRLVSGNLNAAARDELLESGMADTLTVGLIHVHLACFYLFGKVVYNFSINRSNSSGSRGNVLKWIDS